MDIIFNKASFSTGFCRKSPVAVYRGADLILLYSDSWRCLIGNKHPAALGQPARLAVPEIWDRLQPLFQRVMDGHGSARAEDMLLPLDSTERRHVSQALPLQVNPAFGTHTGRNPEDVVGRLRSELLPVHDERTLATAERVVETGFLARLKYLSAAPEKSSSRRMQRSCWALSFASAKS